MMTCQSSLVGLVWYNISLLRHRSRIHTIFPEVQKALFWTDSEDWSRTIGRFPSVDYKAPPPFRAFSTDFGQYKGSGWNSLPFHLHTKSRWYTNRVEFFLLFLIQTKIPACYLTNKIGYLTNFIGILADETLIVNCVGCVCTVHVNFSFSCSYKYNPAKKNLNFERVQSLQSPYTLSPLYLWVGQVVLRADVSPQRFRSKFHRYLSDSFLQTPSALFLPVQNNVHLSVGFPYFEKLQAIGHSSTNFTNLHAPCILCRALHPFIHWQWYAAFESRFNGQFVVGSIFNIRWGT